MKRALLGLLIASSVHANHQPAYVVLAEHRFDPAVQRLLAEQSLQALPLRDGQIYFLYPTGVGRAHLEGSQIRYLELLLEKAEREEDESPQSDEPDTE